MGEITMQNERDQASYYESHKDEPDDWGEPIQSKARRRLASMISVRLSPAEAAQVRAAAEERGVSVSAFLREAALKEAQHHGEGHPMLMLPSTPQSPATMPPATAKGPAM